MFSSAPNSLVLGICPESFLAERKDNFIQAAAELHDGSWVRLGGSGSKYQPNGHFYVYRDHCQSLEAHDIGAWEVEDQPDWAVKKLSSRYRALRRVEVPLEILSARIESDSLTVQEYLTTVGVDALVGRTDGQALVEFSDGVVAKLRFKPHPSTPGWSVAVTTELSQPVDAWRSVKDLQIISFTPNGRLRRFVVTPEVKHAPESLDLATLDEIIQTAARSGGLASYSGPTFADLKKARDKLQEVLKTFPPLKGDARRMRIEKFLSDADHAATVREDLNTYISTHPAFSKAVESRATKKTEELRESLQKSLRAELHAAETEAVDRIKVKESEYGQVEKLLKEAGDQRSQITGEIETLTAKKSTLENEVHALRRERENPPIPSAPAWFSPAGETSIKSPEALVTLIEKNLSALGINGLAARNIGFEAVTASSLGQAIFFRGSLARPVAEAVGLSFAGSSLRTLRVTLGLSDALPLDFPGDRTGSGGSNAVLLIGANLACLDTYGEEIKRAVFQKRLFPAHSRAPIILGTLEDGASALPLHGGFFDLGPVLDTDVLPWKQPSKDPVLTHGRLETVAFHIAEGEVEHDFWDEVIKCTSQRPGGLWPGMAMSVMKRLTGLSSIVKGTKPATSFLYGWLIPRLLASQTPLGEFKDAILSVLAFSPEHSDPRVLSLLSMNGMEGEQ
jgi:hypothetical protein